MRDASVLLWLPVCDTLEFDETCAHDDYSVIRIELSDYLLPVITSHLVRLLDEALLLEAGSYKGVMRKLARSRMTL